MTLTNWARKVQRAAAKRQLTAARSRNRSRLAKLAGSTLATPFKIDLSRNRVWTRGPLGAVLERSLEHMFLFPQMDAIYRGVHALRDDRHFVDKVLQVMNISYEATAADLARLPRTGPVVVVCNHPFGAIEGLVLAALLRSIRPDVKVMANYLLSRLPELDDVMLYVDPFGKKESAARNLRSLRQAVDWVKDGGMLAIFPAGTVSHLNLHQRAVVDPPWSLTVARIIRRTKANVTPIFFTGANGPMFQLAGLVHPMLRTAMLPRELLNKQHSALPVRIGKAISFSKLQTMESDEELVNYLRLRTYILASRDGQAKGDGTVSATLKSPEPIIEQADPAILQWEIDRLPAEQTLVEANPQMVYYATAMQAPHILRELGRLREITFRLAGEGTGKPIDLDAYDPHYYHMFIWNKPTRQIVGAYRLGLTDQIVKRFGVQGLYTSELFGYDRKLLDQIKPALELGRAFVRPEFQRSYSSLMLLWKGIGHFIAKFPRYRYLLGPVSINNEYQSVSRELIIEFLQANCLDTELARLLRPKNPPKKRAKRSAVEGLTKVVRDIEDVSALVGEIESDHKGVPILLRQYLKLNTRILGFNLDPSFGDVIDGLILVDLLQTEPRILEKYMGVDGKELLEKMHQA